MNQLPNPRNQLPVVDSWFLPVADGRSELFRNFSGTEMVKNTGKKIGTRLFRLFVLFLFVASLRSRRPLVRDFLTGEAGRHLKLTRLPQIAAALGCKVRMQMPDE